MQVITALEVLREAISPVDNEAWDAMDVVEEFVRNALNTVSLNGNPIN